MYINVKGLTAKIPAAWQLYAVVRVGMTEHKVAKICRPLEPSFATSGFHDTGWVSPSTAATITRTSVATAQINNAPVPIHPANAKDSIRLSHEIIQHRRGLEVLWMNSEWYSIILQPLKWHFTTTPRANNISMQPIGLCNYKKSAKLTDGLHHAPTC